MGVSIPESVTAERRADTLDRPVEGPVLRSRRALLARTVLRRPIGIAGLALTVATLLVAVFADQIAPADPFASVARPLRPPSAAHLMGTDDLGRDVLSGVVHGARTSWIVMVSVVALSATIGIAVGAAAGYRGGLLDDLLMRLTELVQALPRFFLAVVSLALFGPGMDKVILVLGVTSWPTLARVVRAETLTTKERDFVEAARALGASGRRILVREILPNVLPSAIVVLSLMAATVILLEASLSFIGLGDPNVISWGHMASRGQDFLRMAWWMVAFPGAAIVAVAVGLGLLADAVNDALDPLREQRALGRGGRWNGARRWIGARRARPGQPSEPGPATQRNAT